MSDNTPQTAAGESRHGLPAELFAGNRNAIQLMHPTLKTMKNTIKIFQNFIANIADGRAVDYLNSKIFATKDRFIVYIHAKTGEFFADENCKKLSPLAITIQNHMMAKGFEDALLAAPFHELINTCLSFSFQCKYSLLRPTDSEEDVIFATKAKFVPVSEETCYENGQVIDQEEYFWGDNTKAYTYHDGHNFRSIFINADFDKADSTYEEVSEDLEILAANFAIKNRDLDKAGHGYESFKVLGQECELGRSNLKGDWDDFRFQA